jgi:hypothetical protein
MLGLTKKKGPPTPPFTHTGDCRIMRADPGFEPPWSNIGRGHWQRECQCGVEHFHEYLVDRRPRLDPLDPATARHLPQCELVGEGDRTVLKMALRVKPGLAEGYDWVTCGACDGGWQVPHHAAAD